MPKLKFGEGITLYPLEILLLISFPFLARHLFKFRFQFFLVGMWSLILLSTILSNLEIIDIGGLMRVVKGLIYIPLGYIGFKYFKAENLKGFLWVGITASLLSLFFLVQNIALYGINIWDVRTIGAGLSNRFISIPSFELGTIESGAHGIWGNYCVMVLMIAIYLRQLQQISTVFFTTATSLCLIGIGMSVSREAMITFVLLVYAISSQGISIKKLIINKYFLIIALLVITLLAFVIYSFGEQIPLLQKLFYTVESLETSGTESNIQLRINGWIVFFESLWHHPEKILTGYGFNLEYYSSFLNFAKNRINFDFVALPESYFIFAFCFGGIIAFVFAVLFFIEIFKITSCIKEPRLKKLTQFFFIGLLIGNTVSGASILSDLLYGQVLLFLGYLKANEYE